MIERVLHLRLKLLRICLFVRVEIGADLGRDRESGRHRQAEIRHFGEVRALAAEEILHLLVPLGLRAAEEVNALADLAGLRAPIDAFFDKVTVNVQDKPDLRLNRLKLLNQIRATMDAVADFSKIEG